MRFLKLIVEVRYNQTKPELLSYRERIIKNIAKDTNLKLPEFNEGFEFLVKGKSMKVVVENKRLAADIVVPDSIPNAQQYAQDNIVKVFKQVNLDLKINQIDRIGVRSLWHQEVDLSIKELIQRFKTNFFQKNEIVKSAEDIALVFTLKDNDRIINYNSGPMSVEQLSQMVNGNLKIFGSDSEELITNPAVFMDYDYYLQSNIKFSDSFIAEFVSKATNESKKTFMQTLKLLEVNYV